jgi:predicted transposase YbfD/YdcC
MQWARKSIAAQIQQAQADYILSLKANHPTLFQQVDTWFQASRAADTLPLPSEHKIEAGHHRREIRSCWALPLDQLPPLYQAETWVGLQTIVIVERTRHLWNHTTHEVQFYLSSLPADSPRIAAAIRQHWGLKIPCIGLLMSPLVKMLVGFVLHAPHNLALLRRFAVNTLNRESTFKRSLKQKSKRAAMDDAYMLTLLAAALPQPNQEPQPSCQ